LITRNGKEKMKVKEKLQLIFRDLFEDDSIELNDSMTSNDIEDWDSLMHINLIICIEEEFKIKLTTNEAFNTKSVGEFINLIVKKIVENEKSN
jgi:acyl carrier protein